jgi:CO/xanthine dehydrogenase FAD-binding subunit
MTIWKTYYLAQSISDALNTLANASGAARLVAGGTDLLLDLQQGRHPPLDTLVDISHVPEMRRLELHQDSLFIGAALPLNLVVASPLVRQHAQALHDAAGLIGGPQVRNTATLGGNVAHALPAADGTIALLALDAQAEVTSLQGTRRLPLGDLFRGPGKSALDPGGDLLVGFHLPVRQAGQASAFQRVMRPQGVAIAILNMAIWLKREADRLVDIRISIGPAGTVPLRAHGAEAQLRGQSPDQPVIDRAIAALLAETHFRTSPHRATAEYRRHTAAVLLKEVLEIAWQRAI